MIGQAHETEGSYPRPRGAMVAIRDVYSPRPCVAAPVPGYPAWSASSLRRSPPGRAGSRHAIGTTVGEGNGRGYRRSLSADARYGGIAVALSARRCSLQRVDALSSELALSTSTLDRTGSGKLSLAVASTSLLFPAVVPT